MGDIGSPTHPHSHVLSIKTWEVGNFFREEAKKKDEWRIKKKRKKNKGKEIGEGGGEKRRKEAKKRESQRRAKGENQKREPEKKKRERKREGKGEREEKKGFCIFMRF